MSLSGILQPVDGVALPGHGIGAYNLYCKTLNGYPPPYGGGDVTGPNVAVNNNLASFNGTTGKIIQDSGVTVTGAGSISGNNTGDVTLGAFGAAPNANGASLAGQVLTLQPASVAQPGGVTTGAQTLAGIKYFPTGIQLNAIQVVGDTNVLQFYESSVVPQLVVWAGPFNAPTATTTWSWGRIGDRKFLDIDGFQDATNLGANNLISSTTLLPVFMWPAVDQVGLITVLNNGSAASALGQYIIRTTGVVEIGIAFVPSGPPYVWQAANSFTAGGNCGIVTATIAYV